MKIKTAHGTFLAYVKSQLIQLKNDENEDVFYLSAKDLSPINIKKPEENIYIIVDGILSGTQIKYHDSMHFSLIKNGLLFCAEIDKKNVTMSRNKIGPWEIFSVSKSPILKNLDEKFPNIRITVADKITSKNGTEITNGVIGVEFISAPGSIPHVTILTSSLKRPIGRMHACLSMIDYLLNKTLLSHDNFWDNINNNIIQHRKIYSFLLNILDEAQDLDNCLCFDTPNFFTKSKLIPDVHFFESRGFAKFKSYFFYNRISWEDKIPVAFWRGSTTGRSNNTQENILTLPRFQLCTFTKSHPEIIDSKISHVCQANDENKTRIENYLKEINLFDEIVPFENFAKYKYLLEIDGNASPWGFFAKLLTGSCILKVATQNKQWYYEFIKPWVHYIPINSDLSDLPEKIEWCIKNDTQAATIGINGMNFARELTFGSAINFALSSITEHSKTDNWDLIDKK